MSEITRIKIFYAVVIFIGLICVGISADKYIFRPDYMVEQEVWCAPETETETCFYFVCENDWWTPCTGDPSWDIWTFKIVEKNIKDIDQSMFAEHCMPGETTEEESCPEIYCEEGEEGCETTYCDPDVDEYCYTPEAVDVVDAEWRAVLSAGGIEPVEVEEVEDPSVEGLPLEDGDNEEEPVENEVVNENMNEL